MNKKKFISYKTVYAIAFSSLFSAYSAVSYALPDDKNQPMDAVASNATLDDKTGVTTLTGAVKVVQGSMNLMSDVLVIYRDEKGEVTKMIATGKNKTAFFSQQQQVNQPVSKAWGNKMVYSIAKQTLTITGNARVEQLKDKFTGEVIVYHMDRAFVEAKGGKQRVKMIIQPKAK